MINIKLNLIAEISDLILLKNNLLSLRTNIHENSIDKRIKEVLVYIDNKYLESKHLSKYCTVIEMSIETKSPVTAENIFDKILDDSGFKKVNDNSFKDEEDFTDGFFICGPREMSGSLLG